MSRQIRYYTSFADDFEKSPAQDFVLPADHKWVRTDGISRVLSGLIYGLALVFGSVYCRCFLHMKIKGRNKLRGIKGGCFIYGNHTQPVGDVFIPALCALPKRIYTVVSTANYGIPVIGRLLPFLGALPVVHSLHGLKELNKAIEYRLEKGHPVVIYPEAHVWKYYTGIRPFPDTSFQFPVRLERPAFAMTVTYKKAPLFRKPVTEVFLDGPFYPRGGTKKEKTADLHQQIYGVMQKRSENSDHAYITYCRK